MCVYVCVYVCVCMCVCACVCVCARVRVRVWDDACCPLSVGQGMRKKVHCHFYRNELCDYLLKWCLFDTIVQLNVSVP